MLSFIVLNIHPILIKNKLNSFSLVKRKNISGDDVLIKGPHIICT